jgi:hypothetical protein
MKKQTTDFKVLRMLKKQTSLGALASLLMPAFLKL